MAERGRGRYTTYLVAVPDRRDGAMALVVYAAMKRSAQEALAAVGPLAGMPGPALIVGSLSPHTAKAIGLKPDEVRLV